MRHVETFDSFDSFRDHDFFVRGHRSTAVELQLVLVAVPVRRRFIVSVLVGVVVGQGHLAKLLLRSEGLGPRLQVLKRKCQLMFNNVHFLLAWKSPR